MVNQKNTAKDNERPSLVERPNKTALKKEHQQVQVFAEKLVKNAVFLKSNSQLPEQIMQQIKVAQKIKGNAYRRQIKHIANLLVKHQGEATPTTNTGAIQAKTLALNNRLLTLCNRLIEEENLLQNQILEKNPAMERQHLRNLILQARREKKKNLSSKARNSLMHYLREHDETFNSA